MPGPKFIKSLERGLLVLQALQMQPDSSLRSFMSSPTSQSRVCYASFTHSLAQVWSRGGLRMGATASARRFRTRLRAASAATELLKPLHQFWNGSANGYRGRPI
jgi:IclR family transcriptional regulator, mhp operon transcriptional activator